MQAKYQPDSDMWILNGSKNWITNSPIADVFIIWAQTPEGLRWGRCYRVLLINRPLSRQWRTLNI